MKIENAETQLSIVNYQLSIKDIIADIAQRIFNGEKITYDPDLLRTTVKPYLDGIAKGYGKSLSDVDYDTPDFKTLQKLTENVFQFSASKDFNLLRDMTNALKGTDGQIRSFDEFRQEVDKMNAKYNINWLRTEYNQAVASSQCAARWTDFEKHADKNPFLQYQAVMDANTRKEHAALHGVIKRYDDDFWDKYYPPNGWGCRCEVIQLPGKNHKETPAKDMKFCKVDDMWKVNVGKKGVVFPKGHPYFINQCGTNSCPLKGRKLAATENPQCEACLEATNVCRGKIEKMQKNADSSNKINEIITQIQKGGRREYISIALSTIHKQVFEVLEREKMPINITEMTISTDRISHALRPFKSGKDKALPIECFVKLPFIIDNCSVYFDHVHKNFWYIFEKNDKIMKYVFGLYEIKGVKEFTLITAGIIDKRNLMQAEIEKIK